MLTIHLHNLIFHAFHGVYEEEQLLGNEFEVNADISIQHNGEQLTRLHQTVNYVDVYEVIRLRMHQPTPLLETIAQELAQAIQAMDEKITSVHITIKKTTPPIENFRGSVGVSYKTGI